MHAAGTQGLVGADREALITKAGVVVDMGQSMGSGCETRKTVSSDVESDVSRSMARARWAISIF
jgi:hypothetical protein